MTHRVLFPPFLAATLLASVSCGPLLGIEPWDPALGAAGNAASTSSEAPGGPTSGTEQGSGGHASTGSTSTDATSGWGGGSGPDGGGSPSTSATATSTAAGPCGGLDECMGACLDCFGGGCVVGEARCEPGLLGTATAPGVDAYVAIGSTRIWYGRGATFYELPLRGPGGDALVATAVSGAVSGLTVLGDDAVGAHAFGIVRMPVGGPKIDLYLAPLPTVSGVAVGGGSVWFGGAWSGSAGIYQIDDGSPASGTLSPICAKSGPLPRAVAYLDHELYLGAANQSSIGGGIYHCDSDAPGPLEGEAIDKSVHRLTRTSFGDFAAGAIHDVVPEILSFDDDAISGDIIVPGARSYDVAAWEDYLFFTLEAPLGGLGTDGVYAIALPGGNASAVVRVATCPAKCQAIAAGGDRLVYSAADGSVWSLQLAGVPQLPL